MRIRSLESGTQDPSQGSRAQMPPREAIGKSGDRDELDGHYSSGDAFAMQGGWPNVATSPGFSREASKLNLYVKLLDFQMSAINQTF